MTAHHDHTPAPETLAFARELAALEAANTAQTRRELQAEIVRLLSVIDFATHQRDELIQELAQEKSDAALFLQSLAQRDFDVTKLEAENATLRQQVDALTSERDYWRHSYNTLVLSVADSKDRK